jgi:hypothetical protein
VPWDSITALDLSGGHVSRGEMVLRTALLGGVGSAVFWGGLYYLVSEDDCSGGEMFTLCFDRREWPQVAAFFGGIGLASGALMGLVVPRPERWKKVRLPAHVGVGSGPGAELVVEVSHRF